MKKHFSKDEIQIATSMQGQHRLNCYPYTYRWLLSKQKSLGDGGRVGELKLLCIAAGAVSINNTGNTVAIPLRKHEL